jgi:glucan biosynthesis protein C
VLEFAKNRFRRIGIPFFLAYFTILPLTLVPYLYAEYQAAGLDPWANLREFFVAFYTLRTHAGIMHLWFLEHLIVYYTMAVALVFLAGRAKILQGLGDGNGVRHSVNVFIVLTLTVVLLGGITLLFHAPLPSIWAGWFIPVSQFLYYCFFFILGFILEGHRELFGSFNKIYRPFLLAGSLLSVLTLYIVNTYGETLPPMSSPIIVLKFIFAGQTMLLVIGFIGLFNDVFREPSAFWKYIADAAYWVYLVHMPVVLTTQLLLRDSVVPGILRFPVVIIMTLAICFTSYHYLVRYTWVGALLNGKRN